LRTRKINRSQSSRARIEHDALDQSSEVKRCTDRIRLCGPGVRDVKSDAVKTKDNDVSIEVP